MALQSLSHTDAVFYLRHNNNVTMAHKSAPGAGAKWYSHFNITSIPCQPENQISWAMIGAKTIMGRIAWVGGCVTQKRQIRASARFV
jgi:hypothetical protein